MQWKSIQLLKLCDVRLGYSFRQKPDFVAGGNVLVVQPSDVAPDGTLAVDPSNCVSLQPEFCLIKGDVLLINRSRFTASVFEGTVGKPCIATSAFHILKPKDPAQLLSEYLALFLNSAAGQGLFKRQIKTTTIPFISLGSLSHIEIPVPSMERQRALVLLEKINQSYVRLSSRRAELQKQIAWAGLVSAHRKGGPRVCYRKGRPRVCPIKENLS